MTDAETDPQIGRLSYEEARDALIEVVQRLESGSVTLEESLSLWERGEALADFCQSWLEAARTRLAAAQAEASGQAGAEAPVTARSAAEEEEKP